MALKKIKTDPNLAGIILRLGLGIAMLPHGYQKISNFGGILDILNTNYHLPIIIAALVILIEFFSPIMLLLGVFSRINALLLSIVMLGAGFYHLEHGFFMNWFGNQQGEGYEFHLVYFFAAVALACLGGGKWSLDSLVLTKAKA